MQESSPAVYRPSPLSALCIFHILLKVTGYLPETLLGSWVAQFLQEHNFSYDSPCTFEFMFPPGCVPCTNQHILRQLLISSSWNEADTLRSPVHHHLDGSFFKRWTWLTSPIALRGMCQDLIWYTGEAWLGAVLLCVFLPPVRNTLYVFHIKEQKPRIWTAWNELNIVIRGKLGPAFAHDFT